MPSCNTYHLTWVSLTLDVGVSLHGCSSKAQPLLLTLDEGYLLNAAIPDLQRGIAPLGLPEPAQPLLLGCSSRPAGPGLGCGWFLPAAAPGLGREVSSPGRSSWPQAWGCSSWVATPGLSHYPWSQTRGGSSRLLPLTLDVG